jgi:hypothetical protein
MTAYQYLCFLDDTGYLPCSREKSPKRASKSELRRWLTQRSVTINDTTPQPDDVLTFPIQSLVFFPKGKSKTTML